MMSQLAGGDGTTSRRNNWIHSIGIALVCSVFAMSGASAQEAAEPTSQPTTLPTGQATTQPTGQPVGEQAVEPSPEADAELSPADIVQRALDTNMLGFQSGDAQLRLISQDSHGRTRERQLRIRSLIEDEQTSALLRVISPADMAGQSYLFVRNQDRDDDIWIYMPALDDAPRRIYGNQKNNFFMGTNITYADLESRDIRDGVYTRQPDEELAGFQVYVIDAAPSAEGEQSYSSVRLWIRQTDNIPLRIRFFGEDGEVAKTLFTEEVDESQGRVYVRRMSIVDADEASTRLVIEAIDFEAEVDASEFTEENLVR